MNNRETNINSSRPSIGANENANMSDEEMFQNKTLRPVIKFQQELFLEVFRNYIGKHKNVFYGLNVEEKLVYIDNAVQKDFKFRNVLKGIVIGQFTVKEFLIYKERSSALNKRMMLLVKEQLQYHIQLFELETAG